MDKLLTLSSQRTGDAVEPLHPDLRMRGVEPASDFGRVVPVRLMSKVALQIAVVIATKGRPHALSELLRQLKRQLLSPSLVIISATEQKDIGEPLIQGLNLQCIFGPLGCAAQRNRALHAIGDDYDVVIFFDDDFLPAPEWIQRCADVFRGEPEVVGVSGSLLVDGALTTEISWQTADSLIECARDKAECSSVLTDSSDLYGCNMAFRVSALGGVEFDERLVMYGWLEDMDFSRSVGKKGRLAYCSSMVGVHLGIKSGRVSGRKYGFSQVVNPWYLYRKGTLSLREAGMKIAKALAANGLKSARPEQHIDRRGRFAGNLIGVRHLLSGGCRPEKAVEV